MSQPSDEVNKAGFHEYDTYDNVDKVYPKKKLSIEEITKRIEILLTKTLDVAKKSNKDEDNSHLVCITDIFESIDNDDNSGELNELNENSNEVNYSYKKVSKKVKVKKNATISKFITIKY